MKKRIYLLFSIFLLSAGYLVAQGKAKQIRIPIAFYNLENLFDTINQPNNDEEFLPEGKNQWTQERYRLKLGNMARVIADIAQTGPAVLGVSEIENLFVLQDLVAHPLLKDKNYGIIHYDSPDKRGVDCGILYRQDVFRPISSGCRRVFVPEVPELLTRDVVFSTGLIDGELFHIIVAHWPSRFGGEEVSIPSRMAAAKTMKSVADSLQSVYPQSKVIMMGDFNDDPVDKSVQLGLEVKEDHTRMKSNEYFTPMLKMYNNGEGTLAYRDVWSLFDMIVVNGMLMQDEDPYTFKVEKDSQTGYYAHIFHAGYIMQQSGRFKGYPLRTIVGGQFQGGYSDHFPVYIYLVKQIPFEK